MKVRSGYQVDGSRVGVTVAVAEVEAEIVVATHRGSLLHQLKERSTERAFLFLKHLFHAL